MIRLKEITMEDAQQVLEFELMNKDFFERFVLPRGDSYLTPEGIQQSIKIMNERREEDEYYLYLLKNEGNSIVGRINLFNVDRHKGTAEIGFRVAESEAGKGLVSEAVSQISSVASGFLGLVALEAVVMEGNKASERVLEKCGFIQVEHLAGHLLFKGESSNANLYRKKL